MQNLPVPVGARVHAGCCGVKLVVEQHGEIEVDVLLYWLSLLFRTIAETLCASVVDRAHSS